MRHATCPPAIAAPLIVFLLTNGSGLKAGGATAVEVRVDASRTVGTFRPLHGFNNGPLDVGGTVDLSAYHRALGVPLVRLHDAHWPNPDVVDVHVVFPDQNADPARRESY